MSSSAFDRLQIEPNKRVDSHSKSKSKYNNIILMEKNKENRETANKDITSLNTLEIALKDHPRKPDVSMSSKYSSTRPQ
jgi:hypothetical protein